MTTALAWAYPNFTNLVNNTDTPIGLWQNSVGSVPGQGNVPLQRVKLLRIVGDIIMEQQAQSANSAYEVMYGVRLTPSSASGSVASTLLANSEDAMSTQWLHRKFGIVANKGNAPQTLEPLVGMEQHLGEGFFHFDLKARRNIRPDDFLIIDFTVNQLSGTAQATKVSFLVRWVVELP